MSRGERSSAESEVDKRPAEGFDASAEVSLDGQSSGADSIMGLLMLAASKGKTIDVRAWGPDAEALADAVEALVADRFGEAM